jgi:hypothetical protein
MRLTLPEPLIDENHGTAVALPREYFGLESATSPYAAASS